MSFLSAISSLASLGSSALDAAGATGWLGYSSAKSLNKATAKQNAATSLGTTHYLALNQHGWNVEGLRKAGLNPILAATNLGNTSLANVSGTGGSLSSDPSAGNPVTSALQASNMKKQNDNLDKQNDLLSAEKRQVEANTLKAISEAELNSAKTRNTHQDTLNKEDNRGQSGLLGAYNQAVSDVGRLIVKPSSDFFRRLGSRVSNSAKDFSFGKAKISARMLHETRHTTAPSRRKHN